MIKGLKNLLSKIKYDPKRLIKDFTNDEDIEENIPMSINDVKDKLQEIFSDCSDFVLREITLYERKEPKILICYIDGMVDKKIVHDFILKPIMMEPNAAKAVRLSDESYPSDFIQFLMNYILTAVEIDKEKDFKSTIKELINGDCIIFVDGYNTAIKVGARGYQMRAVEEPKTENVVRGPREGFTENLRTNTALIRRKIKTPKLKFESFTIGEQTQTKVEICYIKGIANEQVVETLRKRLRRIDTDAILESGYIEEFIEDAPLSFMPTIGNTEKPDVVAGKILEGRVAIITDGTPFVLTVPYLFVENIIAGEDYYTRPVFAVFSRIIRFIALLIAATAPALYIALTSFHFNVVPFELVLTIAGARAGIPFTPFTEAIIMGVSFELLREAGVRMPGQIGQAVSIVGALVLGEAAINAGLTSPTMVVLIAATAISSFILPPLIETLPLIRLIFLILANILGLLGIIIGGAAIFIHLCSIRSFGVPYMSPFAPLGVSDLKDTWVRFPLWTMVTRPRAIIWDNANALYRMKVDYRKKED